ncbi:MAG: CDGSH iron-sulfur domain-containing protein [Rubrivivax sp.]|nr:CDGSH iron-sulfur domain-containing protein [Rubrivivax sp.]
MAHPVRASDTPFAVAVEQGKDYWWCACGLSKSQPFCDGSHNAAREFTPVKYTASQSKTVYFCGCKGTARQPLCDGSHKQAG